jgi:hypothetical protein
MKGFPASLTPENFAEVQAVSFFKRRVCYMRRHVYEAMLNPSFVPPGNCGINLQNVPMGEFKTEYTPDAAVVKAVAEELQSLGWETNTGFGGTTLFVYTPGTQPGNAVNCHGFE